jgi:hypothetical protein
MTDLRMGSEPNYVFRFVVARAGRGSPLPVAPEQLRAKIEWSQLAWVWNRIWKPLPVERRAARGPAGLSDLRLHRGVAASTPGR